MRKKNCDIVILTSAAPEYGSGHFRRMCTLAVYLSSRKLNVSMYCPFSPSDLPDEIKRIMTDEFPESARLILRDMRDSSFDEIISYKKHSSVIAFDDVGQGRMECDDAIDLLPNLVYEYDERFFIPGLNFYSYLFSDEFNCEKQDAVLVYSPFSSVADFRAKLESAAGKFEVRYSDKVKSFEQELSRCRFIVSHFGVSFFEAAMCGTKAVAVNTSLYHSQLCFAAKTYLDICDAGVFPEIDYLAIHSCLSRTTLIPDASPTAARNRIAESMDLIFDRIIRWL